MANAALIAIPLVIGSLGFVALAFPADAGLNHCTKYATSSMNIMPAPARQLRG